MTVAAAAPPAAARNTRAQDLFLLAKGAYRADGETDRVELARRIVGFHNLHDPARMSLRDAAWVVVNDMFPLVAARLSAQKMTDFLMSLGPHPICGPGNHAAGYFAGLIDAVLSEVCAEQVRDGERWLMPFPLPEKDPDIAALLSGASCERRRSR